MHQLMPFMNFTWSTRALKLRGSFAAKSARTLRLTCMLFCCIPCMKVEYGTCEPTTWSAELVVIALMRCAVMLSAAHSARQWLTPWCLVPALICSIHNERMSLFFCLLSLYWYCKAFSTLSRAILTQFLARPLKPLASFRILSFLMAVARA